VAINRCLITSIKSLLTAVLYNQLLINVVAKMEMTVKVIWLQEVLPKAINRQRLVAASTLHPQAHQQDRLLTTLHLLHQAPVTSTQRMVKQLVDHLVMFPTMVAATLQMVSTTQVMIMLLLEVMVSRLQLTIPQLGKVEVVVEI